MRQSISDFQEKKNLFDVQSNGFIPYRNTDI